MVPNEVIFLIYCSCIGLSIFGALLYGTAALTALMSLFLVFVNVFVTKHVSLLGFTATAADPIAIGIPLTLNVLQEHCGPNISKRAIWISFYCALIFMLLSTLHLWYAPAAADTSHEHFQALFAPMPRILAASFATFLITQYTDWHLYYAIRRFCTQRFAFLATLGSTTISQAVDTVTFTMLGLYGIMHNLLEIMLVSYVIKLMTLGVLTPFTICTHSLYGRIRPYLIPQSEGS